MTQVQNIEEALDRFEAALRQLEASMVRWHEREASLDQARHEADALRADRSRMADELDAVRAKASELAEAGRQAARHVDSAMARIRNVLGE